MDNKEPTIDVLKSFLAAFNSHDIEQIMAFFSDDCILQMPRGRSYTGFVYKGKDEVKSGLMTRLDMASDLKYIDDKHWVSGDYGFSEWTLISKILNLKVRGTDHLQFENGKVKVKNSFWKIVES